MEGTVKFCNQTRGFGFVQISDGNGFVQEYFFHCSNAANFESLRSGDYVEFYLDDDPRHADQLIAVDVRIEQ